MKRMLEKLLPGSRRRPLFVAGGRLALGILLLLAPDSAQARLKQFDVFFGYDSIVPEGNWFPVTFEVQNDGPAFEAVFEISPSTFSRGNVRRMAVELPTGTLKRFVMPVFHSGRGHAKWDVVVRDSRGVKRDEQTEVLPRRIVSSQAPLFGALCRNVGGLPTLPNVEKQSANFQPFVARLLPDLFPDHPIALEGLAGVYLNAEKAMDLKENQVRALLAWLSAGGHLVVGLHQPSDAQASPWLRDLIPFEPSGQQMLACQNAIAAWPETASPRLITLEVAMEKVHSGYRIRGQDADFASTSLPVVTGRIRDGQSILSFDSHPLVVSAPRQRGTVTVLTFSPESEPFRSWKNRDYWWAKLLDIPPAWYRSSPDQRQHNIYGGWSIDAAFGAIVDSWQIRKLPVGWLLLLLLTYLAIIGPLDQYVLKKINRQMLTWLTFPAYVVLFSGLIYLIGYKLRAGDVEWNEFHVVDVIPNQSGGAGLRGRTFSSIYSPSNARYPMESALQYAALREENVGGYGGGLDSQRAEFEQRGNQCRGEVAVPVWTSQMFVGEWWHQTQSAPLSVECKRAGNGWELTVQNHLADKLEKIAIVADGRMGHFEGVAARQTRSFTFSSSTNPAVAEVVGNYRDRFSQAAAARQSALGSDSGARPRGEAIGEWAQAACFLRAFEETQNHRQFSSPRGFDLSAQAQRGDVIVLAWLPETTLVPPLHGPGFKARRTHLSTLLRLDLPQARSGAE